MNKSNLMSKAHSIAKTLIGDYAARLSLALKMVWAEIKNCVKVLSNRALEIKKELGVTEEEAELLEKVEKKYQEEYARDSKINFSLWEKASFRRVYISCPWRAKNANAKGNYYDLNERYLFDRYIRM